MKGLTEYTLPIQGLKNGLHTYKFKVNKAFFTHFENSPIENGLFDLTVILDKRDSILELDFDFEGHIATDCDRCTNAIQLPFGGYQKLIIKRIDEDVDEDVDIIFLSPDVFEFNIAKYVYEFICLSMPFNKVYDCENDNPRPCNMDILTRLGFFDTPSVSEPKKSKKNPFDDLRNMFNDN